MVFNATFNNASVI